VSALSKTLVCALSKTQEYLSGKIICAPRATSRVRLKELGNIKSLAHIFENMVNERDEPQTAPSRQVSRSLRWRNA